MRRWRQCGQYAFAIVVWIGWWAAVGTAMEWIWPRSGEPQLGFGALFGGFMGIWTLGGMYALQRGWISGFLFDHRAREAQRQKMEQLARDREQITQDARAKVKRIPTGLGLPHSGDSNG